jgi:hypothetical protein
MSDVYGTATLFTLKASTVYVLSVTNIHHTKFVSSTIVTWLTALQMLNYEESHILYSDKYSINEVWWWWYTNDNDVNYDA